MKHRLMTVALALALVVALSACSPQESELPDLTATGQDVTYPDAEDGQPPDAYAKRTMADAELAKKLTLAIDETQQIALPFAYEEISYSTDDPLIATISKDGHISGKSGGQIMVHAKADGLWFHFLVTVEGAADTENIFTPYAGFDLAAPDLLTIEEELELYSRLAGMETRSGLNAEENIRYTDVFVAGENLSPCEVKYKLLTTIDYLQMGGYSALDVLVEADAEGNLNITYYAV